MKKTLNKIIKNFLPLSASLAALALVVSFFTQFTQAQLYQIYPYIRGSQPDVNDPKVEKNLDCPQLEMVDGVGGAPIIKDKCTNTYWYNYDLPLIGTTTSVENGYTWQEAKSYCEGIAVDPETKAPILRLPTADELFAMVQTPCSKDLSSSDEGACSPLDRYSAAKDFFPTPLTTDKNYFYHRSFSGTTYTFAEGAYWASNELDIDRLKTTDAGAKNDPKNSSNPNEAAASVNLKYGTVNNPIFGKEVRLNVRCIYDFSRDSVKLPSSADIRVIPTEYRINSMQWWAEDKTPTACNGVGRKLKMGYRGNLQPNNGDVNLCPEKLNSQLSGENSLCTGVTPFISNCIIFQCPSTLSIPKKGSSSTAPIVCEAS